MRRALPVVAAALVSIVACKAEPPAAIAEPVQAPPSVATAAPAPSATVGSALALESSAAEPPPDDDPEEFRWPPDYAPPEIWEQKRVVIDGVTETWSLRWREPPHFNGCSPNQGCACYGLDWGLTGQLELVRERPGAPVERLDLADVHRRKAPRAEGEVVPAYAVIPGFEPTRHDDGLYLDGKELRAPEWRMTEIVKRKHVEVMKLRDYDHDGLAAEFILYVGYLACGQNPSTLVGISRDNMHLHAFGVTMIYPWEWDRILRARGPSIDVELHVCGDHGGGGDYAKLFFDRVRGMYLEDDPSWTCDWDEKKGFQKKRVPPSKPGVSL